MRSLTHKLLFTGLLAVVAAVVFVFAHPVAAQVSIDFPTGFAGFSSQDLKTTIENIVRIVLGFIGIIFLVLLLYGGFIWMTSAGAADKIERAKRIIASAVIGLMITISAYAIASFIVNSLQTAVSPGPPTGSPFCGFDGDGDGNVLDVGETCDDGGLNGTQGFCNTACNGYVSISSDCINPGYGADGIKCTGDEIVRVCGVSGLANRNQAVTVTGYNFCDNYLAGTSAVTFEGVPATIASCSGSEVWSNNSIVAIIPPTAPLAQNAVAVTNELGNSCSGTDCTSTIVTDGVSPFIECMDPTQGPNGTTVTIDGGNFGAGPASDSVFMSGLSGAFDNAANVSSWSDDQVIFDVPSAAPFAVTGPVFVRTDIGLATEQDSNAWNFTVTCSSAFDPASPECATGCCSSFQCKDPAFCAAGPGPGGPQIYSISPNNGEEGNFVTIQGVNFGATPDELHFVWDDGATPPIDVLVGAPASCGGAWWSNTQIIMQVPDIPPAGNTPDGPYGDVYVVIGGTESNHVSFEINDTVRPGLCSVAPDNGLFGTLFNLVGTNFNGISQDIFFGTPPGISAQNQNITSNTTANATVPNLVAGLSTVAIAIDGQNSNPLYFTINAAGSGDPIINDVVPNAGPDGTYVTIMGSGFGTTPGQVWFADSPQSIPVPGTTPAGDFVFPAICSTDFWRDDRIVVKAPIGLPDGNYFVFVRNAASDKYSANQFVSGVNEFTADDALPLAPGLCRIDPIGGPAGTRVNYFGDNFGTVQGSIWFDPNQEADYTSPPPNPFTWNNQQALNPIVPLSAVTGSTTVHSISNQVSNPLPFNVGSCTSDAQCGAGNYCCSGLCRTNECTGTTVYEEQNWSFTSGQFPFDLVNSVACTEGTQSPSPYPFDQQGPGAYDPTDPLQNAPVNSLIAARFTRALDFATIIPSNVRVVRCNADPGGATGFVAGSCDPVANNITSEGQFLPLGGDGFRWKPNDPLFVFDNETWYEVQLDSPIGSASSNVAADDGSVFKGSQLLENPLVPTVAAFRWHFRTRTAAQGMCNVSNVAISPATMTAPVGGISGFMTGVPTSDQCFICNGSFEYAWQCSPAQPAFPAEYARFYPNTDSVAPNDGDGIDNTYCTPDDDLAPSADTIRFEGFNITPDQQSPSGLPLDVNATITNAPGGPVSSSVASNLSVAFVPPRVSGYGPTVQCATVCTNALPFAKFTVDLAASTVTNSAADLYRCSAGLACDPADLVLEPNTVNPISSTEFQIVPNASQLQSGTWYRAIVRDTISNTQGQTLAGLNFDEDGDGTNDAFSWTFQTSFEICDPTGVDIEPKNRVVDVIGSSVDYSGIALVTDPLCGAFPVDPTPYTWNWTSSDPLVAPITNSAAPYQTATALSDGATLITALLTDISTSATTDLTVIDRRDSITLIGHRPDAIAGTFSPPEALVPPAGSGGCPLGVAASACGLQCTNVLVSAIFSTGISASSLAPLTPTDPPKFTVQDLATDTPVPGILKVTNYTDSEGFCTLDETVVCTSTPECDVITPGSVCSRNRGRVDFIPSYAASDIESDLAAYYSFESATARDESGATPAHHGEFMDNAITIVSDPEMPGLGRVLQLDGDGDYVAIDDSAGDLMTSGSMTWSIWVKPESYVPSTLLSVLSKASAVSSWNKLHINSNGRPWMWMQESGGPAVLLGPSADPVVAGEWGNIIITADAASGQLTMYINGKRSASVAYSGSLLTNTEPVRIGIETGGVDRDFAGRVDEFKIYHRALTPSEVLALYSQTVGQSVPAGVFGPASQFEARLCGSGSCDVAPILSAQGVPYSTPAQWGFTTGAGICTISFVEITPNPAVFGDRQRECFPGIPQCIDTTYKTLTANAKDASGLELSGVTYTWTETAGYGGPYDSAYYQLNQLGDNGNAWHLGALGTDFNEVTASGTASLNLGRATARGKMEFPFCQNPWLGDSVNAYYRDANYDFLLQYCRDVLGDDSALLPNLPAPHIERTTPAPFTTGSDLLKEHVFIVDTTASGSGTITTGDPSFVPPNPAVNSSYAIGDVVSFKVNASDPEGDSFKYTMTDEGASDPLPASASFNRDTGSFVWVVDALPQSDGDANPLNDFALTFGLTSGSDTRVVYINVDSGAEPQDIVRPVVQFGGPAPAPGLPPLTPGATFNIFTNTTLSFQANGASLGSLDGTGASAVNSFIWDFQDGGATSYGSSSWPTYIVSHTFVQQGSHQVTFRVQNNFGTWSLPTVVNVNVRQPVSISEPPAWQRFFARAGDLIRNFFGRAAHAQIFTPPYNLRVDTSESSSNTVLIWQNGAGYDAIKIYRDGVVVAGAEPGSTTTYSDGTTFPGTDYTYRVCGVIGATEECATIQITAREADYDVIVARVYKNQDMLSIREWYDRFAPNPVGSPTSIVVDGYPALQDGTSIYVGMANCVDPADCGAGSIYTNVLLVSYNASARPETLEVFRQLVTKLEINDQLDKNADGLTKDSWSCSDDAMVFCDENHDADCISKNAGLCTSPKAELRRDYERVVELHDIAELLDDYALANTYCDDGSNSIACTTNADCPLSGVGVRYDCVGAYPALAQGSYIGGMSTSKWPSWSQSLATILGRPELPVDPVNQFGANFYSPNRDSCNDFPGFDAQTCWNERSLEFQCHEGSLVYVYRRSGNSFIVSGQVEAEAWAGNWVNVDPRILLNAGNAICNETPTAGSCGNGVVEYGEQCDGGSTNYCDERLWPARWNNEIQVGCDTATCTWIDLHPGNTAAARAFCGGACGDGTIASPFEKCEGSNALDSGGSVVPLSGLYSCSSGGSVYCSNLCQVACTLGRPYTGECGNGAVELPELCDDGVLNGEQGYCNALCSGYSTFCGDGVLQSGEECDGVLGMTAYSCPSGTTLYCDGACNRACTDGATPGYIQIDTAGNRGNDPIFEYYFASGATEDYDYGLSPVPTSGYSSRGITFYVDHWNRATESCATPGLLGLWRYEYTGGASGVQYHYLQRGPLPSPPSPYSPSTESVVDADPSDADADPLGCVASSAFESFWQPVYELTTTKSNGDIDYYYSRSNVPRTNNEGQGYIFASGSAVFYAELGPLQQACGNDIIEGNEQCEPDIYQTPAPAASGSSQQYLCGEALTVNACTTYGGYCGNGGVCSDGFTPCVQDSHCLSGDVCTGIDRPFEECDEGTSSTAAGICRIGGNDCETDYDCPINGDSCVGNGALCNNNAGNCTYCTENCGIALVPRNYCGDGIVNCGINTPWDCTDNDPFTEVCDDGTNLNGTEGHCNETCSGLTGAQCGNGIIESICSSDPSIACSVNTGLCSDGVTPCGNNAECPGAATCGFVDDAACVADGGSCGGEVCDDGLHNGGWSYTCSHDNTIACTTDANCQALNSGSTCSNTPFPYCSFTCLARTQGVCGDGFVQSPEACDHGYRNGEIGYCNASCSSFTPPVCGDGVANVGACSVSGAACNADSDCPPSESCVNGEECDPPTGAQIVSCTDNGQAGILRTECLPGVCKSNTTECHAFGLKIWSEGADAAYLNGQLMTLNDSTPLCSVDPAPHGVDYSNPVSPPGGNACTVPFVLGTRSFVDAEIDSNYVYAFGENTDGTWRIEKRNLSDGNLDPTFDDSSTVTPGAVKSDVNSGAPMDIAMDANYIYAVGCNKSAPEGWRIEKRRKSDGRLCDSSGACTIEFGNEGVLTVASGPTSGCSFVGGPVRNIAETVALDISENRLLVGGSETPAGLGTRAAFNRYALTSGSLMNESHYSLNDDGNHRFVYRPSNDRLYVLASRNNGQWVLEERSANTFNQVGFGSILLPNTGYDGGLGSPGWALEIDETLGIIAVGGPAPDGPGGCQLRRLEMRSLSTGNLINPWGDGSSEQGSVEFGCAFTEVRDLVIDAAANELVSVGGDFSIWARGRWDLTTGASIDYDTGSGFAPEFYSVLQYGGPGDYIISGQNGSDQAYLFSEGSVSWSRSGIAGNPGSGITSVPYQSWNTPSDLRPNPQSLVSSLEQAGQNVIAVKSWAVNSGDPRSFQAVYTSQNAKQIYPTLAGSSGSWKCSNVYTPGWDQVTCPDNDGNGYSDCHVPIGGESPSISSWRFANTYTGNGAYPLCDDPYANFVGGDADWIWGPQCDASPPVVYCRLEFIIDVGGGSVYGAGEYCGDGAINGPEACDNGGSNGSCPVPCSSICTVNSCS